MLSLLSMLGYGIQDDQGAYLDLTLNELNGILSGMGIGITGIAVQQYENIASSIRALVLNILRQGDQEADFNELSTRIFADRFWMVVQKK